MTDNRMTTWRGKLREKGGAILQVHLDKQTSDRINLLCSTYGFTKREVVENAIAYYQASIASIKK